MALFLHAVLLLLPDEVDSARQALTESYQACDRAGADRALGILVKLDNDRCPESLSAAYKIGADVLSDLEKEQKKYWKEVDANQIVRDKDGHPYSRGDLTRYYAAKKSYDAVTQKADVLNSVLPRSMVQLSKLSSLSGLIATLRGSPEWLPRAAAADALGRSGDPAALEALLAQAKVESAQATRTALAEALGGKCRESLEARKLLLSWLESPFWQLRITAARALGRSGDRALCVPGLISVLRTSQGRVRWEINESLKALTGVTKHGEPTAWKEWWEKNEEALLGGTYEIKPYERADEQGITSFYGIPFYSSRVIFIIDTSNSMGETGSWKPEANDADKLEGNRRLDVAKFELRKIVRQMPEGGMFDIFSVNAGVTLLSEKMTVASKPTREGALKFIQGLQMKIGTDLNGALTRSLDFAGGGWNAPLREDSIDTIYFLSDGVPTYGMTDRTRMVEQMLDALRYKRIVVHSIAIDAPPQGKAVLKTLADTTGGRLVER